VGAIYAVVAIGCGLAARSRWRAVEAPLDTVKRRWSEQSAWFHQRLLAPAPEEEKPS
jgi:hypothetical protein